MRFIELTLEDEPRYQQYVKEWAFDEAHFTPFAAKQTQTDFSKWLDTLEKNKHAETTDFVPSDLFFLESQDTGDFMGAIHLRYELNDALRKKGGHIGYGVPPRYRNNGCGKYMLLEALDIYRQKKFQNVLLTCDESNLASQKVIETCGGQLMEKKVVADGTILYYQIPL